MVKVNYIYPIEYYESIIKNEINLYVERVPGHCKCEENMSPNRGIAWLYSCLLINKFESHVWVCVCIYIWMYICICVCTYSNTQFHRKINEKQKKKKNKLTGRDCKLIGRVVRKPGMFSIFEFLVLLVKMYSCNTYDIAHKQTGREFWKYKKKIGHL